MENTYVKKEFTAEEFARDMELELVLDGGKPVSVASPNVNRMWLQLTGHFEYLGLSRGQKPTACRCSAQNCRRRNS